MTGAIDTSSTVDTTSLNRSLDELVAVARHLRAAPDRIAATLPRLRDLLAILDYHSTPKHHVEPPIVAPPAVDSSIIGFMVLAASCSHEGCIATWQTPDACLLNFAPAGNPTRWLCRDHHPPLKAGGIRPTGWREPDAITAERNATRTAVLASLHREHLRLVNSRIT